MNVLLKKIPASLEGTIITREEECRICKEKEGKQIGTVDYWDIKNSKIVKCEKCGLAQLDPMLTEEETSKGCLAYYIEESLRVSQKEQEKNLVRNFRRGVLFGYSLKRRNIRPNDILELGPGSGYFSEGIKFVFPEANITIMDVNKEVLEFNQRQHQYNTIQSVPENYVPELENSFDLVIARDIIEHVVDVSKVIQNVNKYSRPNGYFHFITPNGHEDVWKHYLTAQFTDSNSELLINHVNYFDGKGLEDFLIESNFTPVQYYTYKLKTTRRGRGWKRNPKLMAPVSSTKSSEYYITEGVAKVREIDFDKKDVLDKWYINKNRKLITFLFSWYRHKNLIKVAPELNVGHEFYGLFKKGNSHNS
jgi:SAM-dependent methyltransferase